MSHLFLSMGFVLSNANELDQTLIALLWKQLGGDTDGGNEVPLQHVKVYMCAIQNFHIDWIIDNEREEEYDGFGRMGEDGNLYLTSNEITAITKKYVRLYKNRQQKISSERNEKYKV